MLKVSMKVIIATLIRQFEKEALKFKAECLLYVKPNTHSLPLNTTGATGHSDVILKDYCFKFTKIV
jgi:hypothetical protein